MIRSRSPATAWATDSRAVSVSHGGQPMRAASTRASATSAPSRREPEVTSSPVGTTTIVAVEEAASPRAAITGRPWSPAAVAGDQSAGGSNVGLLHSDTGAPEPLSMTAIASCEQR